MEAKLVKREINEQIVSIIDNNTVLFKYTNLENELPKIIEFNVYRGDKVENNSLQAMGGNFPQNGAFSIYNITQRQKNDGLLTDKIHQACLDIFSGDVKLV